MKTFARLLLDGAWRDAKRSVGIALNVSAVWTAIRIAFGAIPLFEEHR